MREKASASRAPPVARTQRTAIGGQPPLGGRVGLAIAISCLRSVPRPTKIRLDLPIHSGPCSLAGPTAVHPGLGQESVCCRQRPMAAIILARDHGPKTQAGLGGSGLLSVDNDDASAERFATLLDAPGISVAETLPWNAYPWYSAASRE